MKFGHRIISIVLTVAFRVVEAVLSMFMKKVTEERSTSSESRNCSINSFYEHSEISNCNSSKADKFHPRKIAPGGLRYSNGIWSDINDGRRIRFRGINLPAKTPSFPANLKNTKSKEGFFESKSTVSFIGRPFSLEDAPSHFRRLSNYGYNLIRLTCTWEAVMHEGPGIIDEAYLVYLTKLVDIASDFGLYILIDPHQDVWSRFSGGDGAPFWTLDLLFKTDDFTLHDTGCAVLHQCHIGSDTPRMLWPTNYFKLVTATMFTLFFAGDYFAPGQTVDGTSESFQQFLQRHYFGYLDAVAESLKDKENVIGFGTMNEPNAGFSGLADLNESLAPAPYGRVLSGFEYMRIGSGEAIPSEFYPSPYIYERTDILNPQMKSVWKSADVDVWLNAGVYELDKDGNRILLRANHFELPNNNFMSKFMKPFYLSVQKTITKHNKKFVTFAEPHLDTENPFVDAPDLDPNIFSWAPHFYDFFMLVMKSFNRWIAIDIDSALPVFSPYLIDWVFRRNLAKMKKSGRKMNVLIGEIGIPFDMGPRTDYNAALNRTLRAVEANDLDFTLWCYCPLNTEGEGDAWNGEDLSIRTKNGNRGLLSAIRPFVFKCPTKASISQHFDPFSQSYKLELDLENYSKGHQLAVDIYVPSGHFHSPSFSVSSGTVKHIESTQSCQWIVGVQSQVKKQFLSIENSC